MERTELVDLLKKLSKYPEVARRLQEEVPRPSVYSVQQALDKAVRRVYSETPYTKDGPAFNDYAYTRVENHLVAFKVSLKTKCRSYTWSSNHILGNKVLQSN